GRHQPEERLHLLGVVPAYLVLELVALDLERRDDHPMSPWGGASWPPRRIIFMSRAGPGQPTARGPSDREDLTSPAGRDARRTVRVPRAPSWPPPPPPPRNPPSSPSIAQEGCARARTAHRAAGAGAGNSGGTIPGRHRGEGWSSGRGPRCG